MTTGSPPPRPTSVQIGQFPVEVVYDRSEIVEIAGTMDQDIFAAWQPSPLRIVVDPDRPDAAVRDSLLHEILHACFYVAAVDPKHGQEHVVQSLSSILLDVLHRNSTLTAFLLWTGR